MRRPRATKEQVQQRVWVSPKLALILPGSHPQQAIELQVRQRVATWRFGQSLEVYACAMVYGNRDIQRPLLFNVEEQPVAKGDRKLKQGQNYVEEDGDFRGSGFDRRCCFGNAHPRETATEERFDRGCRPHAGHRSQKATADFRR